MKLYRNWIINEVARAGEHTNERTYVHTYVRTYSHTYVRDRPSIPSTTLLCEGIITDRTDSVIKLDSDLITESDQAVRAVHSYNSWFRFLFSADPLTMSCIRTKLMEITFIVLKIPVRMVAIYKKGTIL